MLSYVDGKVLTLSDPETQAMKGASLSRRCSQPCPSLIPRRQVNYEDSTFNPDTMQNDGPHRVTASLLQETLCWDIISA